MRNWQLKLKFFFEIPLVKLMHLKPPLLIPLRLRPHQVRAVHVVVVLFLLLNKCFRKAVNGIVNASSAGIVAKLWTRLLLVMDPIRISIAGHAMARNGVHMDMDLHVVQVSCKLME